MEYRSFPEISQWLYKQGTQNTGLWRITHAGLNFTRCPLIEANEQFERSVQVVDRDQLYDPAHYISPSNLRQGTALI
jgi:hypothetical protein